MDGVGDAVVLLRRVDDALVPVLQATLDAAGTARFEVTPGQHPTRYIVRLPATAAHDAARVPVVIPPADPSSSPRALVAAPMSPWGPSVMV